MRKLNFRAMLGGMLIVSLGLALPAYSAGLPGVPTTVTVTIAKYINGSHATAANASNTAFPMTASWSATNIGAGSGNFSLSNIGFNNPNEYEATTSDMDTGADYAVAEVTDGNPVLGINDPCQPGEFKLQAYSWGEDELEAQFAPLSSIPPSFTGLTTSKFVIVWNEICPVLGSLTVTKQTIGGDGIFAFTGDAGAFNIETLGGTGSYQITGLTPGSYSVLETSQPGWQEVSNTCGGVVVTAGQDSTCTIVNAKLLKVHILKYVNGQPATNSSSGSYQFPMTSTWSASNIGSGSGNYVLGNNHGGAPDQYGADTTDMTAPADYTTSEVTSGGSQVLPFGSSCQAGMFVLLGYSSSSLSFADAALQPISSSAPVFTGIVADQYVIVWNKACPAPPPASACTLNSAPFGYALQLGTPGNDNVILPANTMFVGMGGNDKILGTNGNYIICTLGGNDTILIGNGDFTIDAGSGTNVIKTGNGNGIIITGSGADTMSTGNGTQTILAGDGINTIVTGNGNKIVTTGTGVDKIITGSGNDIISAGNGANVIKAGGGVDTITTGSGNDIVDGGAGVDSCSAGGGINTVINCP